MCSCKRRETDFIKLKLVVHSRLTAKCLSLGSMMEGFKVETIKDSTSNFYVELKGPQDSLYQGGVWKVRVDLPHDYPYNSPSIRFENKIYHPNIGILSGNVCLDVLEEKWSPMSDLVNVFEIFLPQLLLYPNPDDPINSEAGVLMLRDRNAYDQKVKEYCIRYARAGDLVWEQEEKGSEDLGDNESASGDEETAGPADP